MKAIRVSSFGDPEALKLEEIAAPNPGRGEVRVKVAAAGVNPVETYIRAGTYPVLPPLPFTPGNDGAGTIETVGVDVELAPGTRVYIAGSTTGTYAELAIAKAAQVHPLPDTVSFDEGAGIGVPYITAYRAIFEKARMQPGETVLVHGGSGAVGLAAIQFLAAFNPTAASLTIIATGGTEQGRRLAERAGAGHVLDHTDDQHFDAIRSLTAGKGVDVILETSAHKNLGKDLTVLARGGRVVVIGSRGEITINPRDLMKVDGQILGLLGQMEHQAPAHAAIAAGLMRGWLRPVISRRFALLDAPEAHRAIMSAPANGKLILTVTSD